MEVRRPGAKKDEPGAATEEEAKPAEAAPAAAPTPRFMPPPKTPAPAAAPASAPADAKKPAAAPAPAAAASGAASAPKAARKDMMVGQVIHAEGGRVLAELPGGAKDKERFIVFSSTLTRKGYAFVVKAVDNKALYLLLGSGTSLAVGDRLGRESEEDAWRRVQRENTLDSYRDFLTVFPDASVRATAIRDMFRLQMRSTFPATPGSTLEGRIKLAETVGQEVSLARAMIKVDRFVVGMTDDKGSFRIDGLPKLEYPIKVKVMVRDEKFQTAGEIQLDLPANQLADLKVDIPVKLTPTYLVGQVVDGDGRPVREAEIWTSPYTMEVLTDEQGRFRLWRKKKLDASGAPVAGEDEPLMGRDYEIYAYRKGFAAERAFVSAESFKENQVRPVTLVRQNLADEGLPQPGVDLRANLDLMQFVVPTGSGPKLNQ
jgi:hypothetical protein